MKRGGVIVDNPKNPRNRRQKAKILGKSLSGQARFEPAFLVLGLVVGLARVTSSLFGGPNAKARFLSLTVVFLLGMIYYSIRVHTSGFGSSRQLLPVLALPVVLGNCIIIAGIILAIETGRNNIFSVPPAAPDFHPAAPSCCPLNPWPHRQSRNCHSGLAGVGAYIQTDGYVTR